MTKSIRSLLVLTAAVSLAGAMGFAQSAGEATYKAKCQSCHGSNGVPSPGIAKMLGVKPVTDPSVKAESVAEMIGIVKNGKGKMKPVTGLSDQQIKEVVLYFRSLE